MFSLRLFGAPGVDGPDGRLTGRIAQRHPLALLALLAANPTETASREKLLALLWPDSDTDAARGLLNTAVHTIRKSLGEGALRTVGGSLLLDPEIVRSDVHDFTAALSRGDWLQAAEAYTGPFLDGFFLDAEEFNRWADAERASLAGHFGEALEKLAEQAERDGDAARAAGWWKRRAAHDPYDSRVALRLVETLAQAGDRAGALRHTAVHTALLREELGSPPDPRIAALEERIRAGDVPVRAPAEAAAPALPETAATPPAMRAEIPAAPPAPAPPPAPSARIAPGGRLLRWGVAGALLAAAVVVIALSPLRESAAPPAGAQPTVAVLPFQPLRGDPASATDAAQDDYLRIGLADEIISGLSRVGGLRVIARTSSFALDGQRDRAAELARSRLGVTSLLEGSVRREGGRLRVVVHLVDLADGSVRWSRQYDASADSVSRVQAEIAADVAAALGRELAPAGPSAPQTVHPEAYDLFLRGRYAWYSRTPRGLHAAEEAFREAVRLDPGFAMAHVGLADTYSVMGGVEYGLMSPGEARREAVRHARRALELSPDLPEAHAALANALMHEPGRWPEAERHFHRAIALNGGADALHWYSLGLLGAGRVDEAREAIRRARLVDPRSPVVSAELARNLYYGRRFADAVAEYRRALEMDPALAAARLGLGLAFQQIDSLAAAVREFSRADSLLGGGHPLPAVLVAQARGSAGDRAEAARLLGVLNAADRQGGALPAEYLAIAYLGAGRTEEAIAHLERAYAANPAIRIMLRWEPLLDPLREAPRFRRLLATATE